MIIIQAVYPCVKCGKEIDPLDEHCRFCGTKQPDLSGRTIYNIFYRQGHNGPFNIRYGGSPILDIEDAQQLALQLGTNTDYEYFIGSFKTSDNQAGETYSVLSWIPVSSGQIGPDQGPQKIQITMLE